MMHLSGPRGNKTPTPLLNAGKFSWVADPFGGEKPGLWGAAPVLLGGEFLLLENFCTLWTH